MIWHGPRRLKAGACATAFGGFGLDPPRPLPVGVLIGSTPSFMRFAMGFSSE